MSGVLDATLPSGSSPPARPATPSRYDAYPAAEILALDPTLEIALVVVLAVIVVCLFIINRRYAGSLSDTVAKIEKPPHQRPPGEPAQDDSSRDAK